MQSSEGFVFVRRGLHLYYHVLGDGPETVVIPNANWLSELLQPLAEMAEGRRLILYDPRSRGRSSAVTDGRHLSLEHDVSDLEAVRRFFGLERLSLLGASYHAAITALYALENPDRVERMLLVCPITPRRPGEWLQETPTAEELAFPPGVPRLEEMRRDEVDREDPAAYCRAWFNYFLLPAQMGELAAASRFPLDDICSFPNEWPQHTMKIYFQHIVPRMEDWDFRPRLAELAMPFLVMQGTDDLVPIEASREWASHAANARFLAIDGAGSHPYIERPKVFFPAADAFLKGEWPQGSETVPGAA
ncbi:MAG TPA: alpha/beta hydrolase [Thermoanaerobaculia bacterium]|jgi:proline iminopeptidase|nr:alpha/beta hydrolase [Thermoanaerobaculia bacterium]